MHTSWTAIRVNYSRKADILTDLTKRITLNVPTMTKISMNTKEMPPNHGYTHILVLLCEVSNVIVALPLHSTRTQHSFDVF